MKKKLINNWGLKILAFLIAAFTWFIVVNVDNPETTRQFSGIKVEVVNSDIISKNSAKTYQIVGEDTVTVSVTAKRSIMNKVDPRNIVATADMNDLQLRSLIPIKVSIKNISDIQVKATADPVNLKVTIEDEMKKSFPITPVSKGTVRDGSILSDMSVSPESITVRGPKSIIENISKVTAEVDVGGLYEDTTEEGELFIYDNNNNTVDQTLLRTNLNSNPTVAIKLLQGKSVPLKINDSLVMAAEGYNIEEIKYEPQEVQIVGEKKVLSSIEEIYVPAGALKLEDLKERTDTTIDVTPYIPEGAELADKNAGKIAVAISVSPLDAKSFEIATNAIAIKNLSDDLQEKFEKEVDIEVQLRGKDDVLNNLTLTNKVSIDLKDFKEPGTYNVPVDLDLPDGVSAVAPVQVEVILEKK